ncbi:hypothetical protein MP638_005214 [Amoeboaphelidium occidentale]|nr:hypothetical protein MP638_005214 [Amoeboaphelidium occidentale]
MKFLLKLSSLLLLIIGVVLTDDLPPLQQQPQQEGEIVGSRLLVTKTVNEEYVVAGSNATFVLRVYNVGKEDASDVAIKINSPDKSFKLLSGSLSIKEAVIPAGKNTTYEVIFVPSKPGRFPDVAAEVSYENGFGEKQKASSSSMMVVYVLTKQEYLKFYADDVQPWYIFTALMSVPTLLPLLNHLRAERVSGSLEK